MSGPGVSAAPGRLAARRRRVELTPRGQALALALAALLLLNNFLFKDLYPGALTGKLSDIAGAGLLALWLAVTLGLLRAPFPRLLAAVAATFYLAWIKLTPLGCAFHEALVNAWMTSTGRSPTYFLERDATDVVAGLAAPLALRLGTRSERTP